MRADRCDEVRAAIAAAGGERHALGRADADHVAGCLGCQAAAVRQRRLDRALRDLAGRPVPVAADLESSILAALQAADDRNRRVSAATLGGLAAGAAAAAGVLALAARSRRLAS